MRVQRLLSLEVVKDKIQNHEYRSMAMFAKDFYELLNNGRTVTTNDSQVRRVIMRIRTLNLFSFL
jgi:hypothetical protein